MKTYLDCYPCFLRQSLEAARMAGANESQQHRVLQAVASKIQDFELTSTAPEMVYQIHRIVRQETGAADPYRQAKDDSTRQALALYPRLKSMVAAADDPLEFAVRLSIAGNIIDLGMSTSYDLEGAIERVLAEPFGVSALPAFRAALTGAKQILYLADNTGETVFDRILIETLQKPVTYVVKGGPILNDATRPDALAAGLDAVAEIVDNGSDAPGTVLELCSPTFRRLFAGAEFIIAKGQGNYESLSGTAGPIFFLLQAKCPVVARDLGAPVKSIVLANGKRRLT